MARLRIVLGTTPAVRRSTGPGPQVRGQIRHAPDRSPRAIVVVAVLTLGMLPGIRTRADEACPPPGNASPVQADDLGTLPVKEITVFKDGHAFVLHEGDMPTDEQGNLVLDYLPAPVIGTFWPYSSDPKAKLTSVVTGRTEVQRERTALNLRELLEANVGAEVLIAEATGTMTMSSMFRRMERTPRHWLPFPPGDRRTRPHPTCPQTTPCLRSPGRSSCSERRAALRSLTSAASET